MKKKLSTNDMINLECYISIDPYLNKDNSVIENLDTIKSYFEVYGFNKEEIEYLSYATIMPYEEINNYINIFDNGEYDELLFISELMMKYLKTNTNDKNKIKQDKEIITNRIKSVRKINSYKNKKNIKEKRT